MSSVVVATLEPIHRQNEVLLHGTVQRPTLHLTAGVPLVLGRNHSTGIAYVPISRTAATLSYNGGQVWISQGGTARPGRNGEFVSLFKRDYAYRLNIKETDKTATTASTTTSARNRSCLKDASEEATCAVCMEIIVETTAIVPCGHFFCKTCLGSLIECPTCRLVVQQTVPLKGMDNLIQKLALAPSDQVFCHHDVQHYWQRTGMQTLCSISSSDDAATPPSPVQSPCSTKRARTRTAVAVLPALNLTTPRQGNTFDDAICIDD